MHRYKYRASTYLVLLTLTFFMAFTLVLALVAVPRDVASSSATPSRTGGDPGVGLPDVLSPPLVEEYRTPTMVLSGAGLAVLLTLLSLSGGVKYIDRDNVLKSPVRRQMYDYVRANPGVYLRELSRTLSLNPTNTTWHLRKLVEAELVRCQMVNGLKVYYPIEGGVNVKKQAIANSILKNENARTMVAFLSAHPGAHQREMARALGVNHGTIRWHLRKLCEAEVVSELREGSHFRYFLTPEGMQRAMTALGTRTSAPPPAAPALEQQVELPSGGGASQAARRPPSDEPVSEPGF